MFCVPSGKIQGWHFIPEWRKCRLHQCLLHHGKSESYWGNWLQAYVARTQTVVCLNQWLANTMGGRESDLMTAGSHPTAATESQHSLVFSCVLGLYNPWSMQLSRCRNQTHHSELIFSSVQLLSRAWLFATPWTAAQQASLSITSSQSPLKLMSV